MDYKKKYNEALEMAKKVKQNDNLKSLHRVINIIFPELKESEDERIRKEIIQVFKGQIPFTSEECAKEYIAWLEKQESIDRDKLAKGVLIGVANSIIQWLDANVAEGNMCLSNMECLDIENCVIKTDWDRVYMYMKKVLEKQGESIRIKKGKNYLCTKTHKYAGMEWIEGVKYYSPEDYSLVNQGCTCYCPKYSKEEHNNFFKEVEYDGCLEVDKLEPKFKVKYAVGEYNVVDEKELNGVTFYGIEDEPNHIDYVKADTCEIINAKPKFNAGDWLVWQDKCYKVNYNGCGYELVDPNGWSTSVEYGTIDEGAHLWTIADAKDGDVLCGFPHPYTNYPWIGIFHELNDDCTFNSYCYLQAGINGKFCPPSGVNIFNRRNVDCHSSKFIVPATKEQRNTLFAKMKELGYEWDAENKELKNTERK